MKKENWTFQKWPNHQAKEMDSGKNAWWKTRIDISASNKVQNTKEIDQLKKPIQTNTNQYKPRNSFLFELRDLITLEYISPNSDLDVTVKRKLF